MPQRAHLLDALGRPGVACVVILFYLLLAVAITVGELGPATLQTVYDEGSSKPCVGDSCSVTSSITLSGLATYNQLLAVSVKLDRPSAENSNEPPPPALEQYRYFPQSYVLSCVVRGSGAPVVISPNVTHTAQVTCNAGSKTCEAFLLAYYPQVRGGALRRSPTRRAHLRLLEALVIHRLAQSPPPPFSFPLPSPRPLFRASPFR